jgi:hypothetical protein
MRKLSLAAALAVVLGATMVTEASAWIWDLGPRPAYRWCAFYNPDGTDECLYSTIAQCRASVSGVGGYCYENPRWVPPPALQRQAKRKPKPRS